MNLNDLRMSLKSALDNMWARIDARITAIEQGGGGGVTDIPHGGTGATTDAGARANLHAMQNPDDSLTRHSADNVNNAAAGFSVWYQGCVNNPFSFHASVLTIANYPGYTQQIAFPWDANETRIAFRVCNGGTWYPWRYITTS